jgi:protoheme IX farnesyltransferase
VALAKPRVVALVAATASAGYFMAAPSGAAWPGLAHTFVGTALVAGGASALNQVAERDVDARMRRTARRPLPAGRVGVESAVVFAWLCAAAGVAYLAALTTGVAAALAAATLAAYAGIYTPLKRRTPLALIIGAVPGALPVVGGWAAAGAPLEWRALALFGKLFHGEVPHILALAVM